VLVDSLAHDYFSSGFVVIVITGSLKNFLLCVLSAIPASDIRISNQFMITRALHIAQPQAYYQASVTITLGRRVKFKSLKR